MVAPTTLYKVTAALISLFCLQHLFVPEVTVPSRSTTASAHAMRPHGRSQSDTQPAAGTQLQLHHPPATQALPASRSPQLLMEMNFIGIELDATHLFFSRILGLLGLFYSGLLVQLPEEVADAVFPYQTLFLVAFYAMGPVFAFLTMPIKSPDFLPGLVLFAVLILTYLHTLATYSPASKKD